MADRKVHISVECCDADTGEMQLTVEDPGNPEPEFASQEMVLHPAACHLLHKLLGTYVTQGISSMQSITLNAPQPGVTKYGTS